MSRLNEYLEIAERERARLMKERVGPHFGRHLGSDGKPTVGLGKRIPRKHEVIDPFKCPSCKGTGSVIDRDMSEFDERGKLEHPRYMKCPDCGGTGTKNEPNE